MEAIKASILIVTLSAPMAFIPGIKDRIQYKAENIATIAIFLVAKCCIMKSYVNHYTMLISVSLIK